LKPDDLLFLETHEWVRVDSQGGSKVGTVGISAFAVEQLTDLVFMELPKVGRQVKAGDEFGEVESVKAVSPIYAPVTGEVIEVNSTLPDHLEILNSDPYGQGSIAKIKITDDGSIGKLMDHAAYQKQCAS
jgi:glycine cleavage system H protein